MIEYNHSSESGNANAINCVHPKRRHPSRNSVMTYHDNRTIILFVTVVTEKRKPILANDKPILANDRFHEILVDSWKAADEWLVGRYVIMPDHIHFFCAPNDWDALGFRRWMKHWKSIASMMYGRAGGSQFIATVPMSHFSTADAINCVPPAKGADAMNCVPPVRRHSLFQRDCWDRQLRTGESYSQKWSYVRNNPVRKGLVESADEWPFQGQICQFEWHDPI